LKERFTVTIDKDVMSLVDHYVDGVTIKNRSHAIEVLLKEAVGDGFPKRAFILAGGQGTRLRPITKEIPKPMIPVQGKPVLEYTIELLKKHGIKQIIISVGYLGERIKEYFGNGSKFGVKIKYVEENEPLGTAGPLRLAKPHLRGNFIVCNGDELKDIDLHDMMNHHKERRSLVTMALTTVPETSKYGVVEIQGDKVQKFIEKPAPGTEHSNLINAGLYIMNMAVLDMIPEDGACMLERDIFPKIAEKGKLYGYPFSGQWYATDTHERYEEAIDNWRGIGK
jgi:mannose-1-phosphate guanylyltransferase